MAEPGKSDSKSRTVLRRDFLTAGGAAIAAGALGIYAPETTAATFAGCVSDVRVACLRAR
jgi:hypothetical protein